MENGFIYLIKASGLIGLFYLAYVLLLKRETFFTTNRWFLLLGLITSTILPLLFITKIIWVEPITDSFDWSKIPIKAVETATEPEINWFLIATCIYILGVVFLLLKLLFDFYSLSKVFKEKTIQQEGKFKLIDVTENIAPFSYFKSIVYNSALYTPTELANILAHEKVHSSQNHSIDVLISRLFCIAFWFNPLIWLYKKAITQNLEFIADSEASKNISDKKAYQLTLLKITTQENCVAISNHFYQSLIKKRIIMLNQNQSKKWNSWKYITVFPALVAYVFLFQIEVIAKEKETPKQENKTTSNNIKLALIDVGKNLDTISKDKKKSNLDKNNTAKTDENNVKTSNNTIGQVGDKSNVQSVLKQDIDNKPLIVNDGIKQASNFKVEEIPTDQIAQINVLKGINATEKYGESGKNGVIEITTKEKNEKKEFELSNGVKVIGFKTTPNQEVYGWKTKATDSLDVKQITPNTDINKVLVIIDGKKTKKNVKDLDPKNIESINVLKDKNAEDKYGKEGKNGVIEIITKEKTDESDFKTSPQKKVRGF